MMGLVLGILAVGFFPSRSWVSGWFPPLVALIVLFSLRAPRIVLFTGITGGSAVMIALPGLIRHLLDSEGYSLITRLEGWQILAEILKINPILGLGPANYYHYTAQFSIRGWYVSFNSHNNFIDIFAQVGLLGLICFLWFFWEMGRMIWRLRTNAAEGFEKGYVYGSLSGLIGTLTAAMFGDWVIPFVYNIGLEGFRSSVLAWVFLGGALAISLRSRVESRF
jgi:O-antigen ligase